jgi:activator of 2-hydroxyglutaryl-CoA dehydratase/predicted nucleotide-binding protein (sugar kinase/HSP70/actin superfamily)
MRHVTDKLPAPLPGDGLPIVGCDLGKASLKFSLSLVTSQGLEHKRSWEVEHQGAPFEAFCQTYREESFQACAALAATGVYASELLAPVDAGLPEDSCLEAALSTLWPAGSPINLIDVGARGYAILARSSAGHCTYLENDKCSSGTGETLAKLASRFGLSLEEADTLAASSAESVAITARCSVFAKSELTHFANQGLDREKLLKGLFESVARHAAALLSRIQVAGPVHIIGGGSRLRCLVEALAHLVPLGVSVPEHALHHGSLGALQLALERIRREGRATLPRDPEALVERKSNTVRTLPLAHDAARRVTFLPRPSSAVRDLSVPAVLGLDLGSTGSKAVLSAVDGGEMLLDLYDRTEGSPVDAARRMVERLLDRCCPDVRAIGVTGSGREAVAAVLRAVFPTQLPWIVVENEIVAHATAAIRCDPGRGQSLSIVEIGGQDAKFIQIVGGQIVESDMNKACSAGTGSFLEEQATLYGVHAIEDVAQLAAQATACPDLGQMCTVFIAETATQARAQGFSIADLFAGFQYAVIRNYMNRVMGTRVFKERIFFQGKPASNPSLAWTLAAAADREVTVPHNPGAMGAWGIALCAAETSTEAAQHRPAASSFDLKRYLEARVVGRDEFQCLDKACKTLCHIDRTRVAVGERVETVLSGGACPKFERSSSVGARKVPREAPHAFEQRDQLLKPYLEQRPGRASLDIPLIGAMHAVLPWFVTFVRELGVSTRVLRSSSRTLSRGEERCGSYDACAPVKVAHGILDEDSRLVLIPRILELPDPEGMSGLTCPMEQGMAEMVERAIKARGDDLELLKPRLTLSASRPSAEDTLNLLQLARRLGAATWRVPLAIKRAYAAQRRYEQDLLTIGRETLAYGAAQRLPVVVVSGPLHVIHDAAVQSGVPKILRANNVLALPMDCYPLADRAPQLGSLHWHAARRTLHAAAAARQAGDAFPLLFSAFGCGPASFFEHGFSTLLGDYPHAAIESDGHGGRAGYTTRVQAFVHTLRRYTGGPSPIPRQKLELFQADDGPLEAERGSRLVVFSASDHWSRMLAASYRSLGFDATASRPIDSTTLACGQRNCSGKECLPYQLIWGSFRRFLEEEPLTKRTVLMGVTDEGQCRNCMFALKDQLNLDQMGLRPRVHARQLYVAGDREPLTYFRFWVGVVAVDILHQLAAYHRPYETSQQGEVDRLHRSFGQELERLCERRLPEQTWSRVLEQGRAYRAIARLLERAARAYGDLASRAGNGVQRPRVLLTGDIFMRIDEVGNGGLIRKLSAQGLHVVVEPYLLYPEYRGHEETVDRRNQLSPLVPGMLFAQRAMSIVRRDLYRRVQRWHPWLPTPDIAKVVKASRELIARDPIGEAPITIGSALLNWQEGTCDGVVVASPWSCAPGLVAESHLQHERQIPMLFVYCDGTPLDEPRLSRFAFRLKRAAAADARPGG